MRALDYILYITHSFLLIVKKLNNEDIEGRAKNGLSIMVFLVCLFLLAILYGLSISNKLISYNKPAIVFCGIVLFLVVRLLIFSRYKTRYYEVIETLKNRFSYSNRTVIFSFLVFWTIPIFLLWIGVIVIRQLE